MLFGKYLFLDSVNKQKYSKKKKKVVGNLQKKQNHFQLLFPGRLK
jgi:hypothetical protein